MRAKVAEIRWHWKEFAEPVLSIDHHPTARRIATAGSDNTVKIWSYAPAEDGSFTFTFIACLVRDSQPVNAVRFVPHDEMLLSGHDGGVLALWQRSERHNVPTTAFETLHDDQRHNSETWTAVRILRGHTEDVYSVAISPDSRLAVSGSIDSTILLWELATGRLLQKIDDHAHYVQGLAWDPLNVYFASQSSDRRLHIYVDGTKKLLAAGARPGPRKRDAARFELDAAVDRDQDDPRCTRLFRDETAGTFFRRLHWSPDGLFVAAVCGQYKEAGQDDVVNCAHVFLRGSWDCPFLRLPVPEEDSPEAVVGARWSPAFYRTRGPSVRTPWVLDQYRMVFALFTISNLLIYDTSCAEPIALVTHLHLSTIADVVWAPDGYSLMVASKDGYVSSVIFDVSELGPTWDLTVDSDDLPAPLRELRRIRDEKEGGDAEDAAAAAAAAGARDGTPKAPRVPTETAALKDAPAPPMQEEAPAQDAMAVDPPAPSDTPTDPHAPIVADPLVPEGQPLDPMDDMPC